MYRSPFQTQAMKKGLLALISIFCLIVVVLSSSLLGESPLKINLTSFTEPPRADDSILRVVQASPTGQIDVSSIQREIVVVFNHPVVPLAALDENAKQAFEITPAVAGKFRWYGSRIAAFIPASPFQPGSKFQVKVKAGFQALNGLKLPKDYSFDFSTPPLQVISVYPYEGYKISYQPNINVGFNYAVDLKELRDHTTLTANGKPVAVQYFHSSAYNYSGTVEVKDERYALLQVLKPIERGAKVILTIKAGMKPKGGNRGMLKSKIVNFETYGPLTVKLTAPSKYFQNSWSYALEFNNPINPKDIGKKIQFDPPVTVKEMYADETTRLPVNYWSVQPGKSYKITISPDLKDAYGNQISGAQTFSVTMPPLRPDFYAESGFRVLESSGQSKIPVQLINLPKLEVGVAPFSIDDVQRYLSREDGDTSTIKSVSMQNWNTGLKLNDNVMLGYDVSKFLSQDRRGFLAIQLEANLKDYDDEPYTETRMQFVQATDLGLTVKSTRLNTHAYVHSLSTGKAMPNTSIEVFDAKESIGTCKTDAQGYCSVKQSDSLRKGLVLASSTNDKAFVSENDHSVYLYSVGNYDANGARPTFSGHILTDRGLYRPGDQVQVKATLTIRENGKVIPFTEGKARIIVRNSEGNEIQRVTLKPSKHGGVWMELSIPQGAPLGHYTIAVALDSFRGKSPEDDSSFGMGYPSATFQVEEFRPVTFSVKLSGLKDVIQKEKLQAELEGRYLFGAPMPGAPIQITINNATYYPSFSNYSEFNFGDESDDSTAYFSYLGSKAGLLDTTGKFKFTLDTVSKSTTFENGEKGVKIPLNPNLTYQIEGNVRDVDQRSVTKSVSFQAFAGKILPGIKIQDRYLSKGQAFQFQFIAVNSKGIAQPSSLQVRVYKTEWKTIQTKGPNGSIQRKNTKVVTLQKTDGVTTSSGLTNYSFTPKDGGSYTLTLQDTSSGAYARSGFYASGGSFEAYDYYNDDSITLVPDRAKYEVGQMAKVLIQSPFEESTAIISVEREKVYWQKQIQIKGNGEPIQIPILEDYAPNVFVSVMLLRPRIKVNSSTEDLGKPKFKMGAVELKVNNESHRAKLTVSTDREQYKPGDTVKVKIHSEPNAEITLSVADRAVTDLIAYAFSDPVDLFFSNWPLAISVFENRRSIIDQHAYAQKGDSPGGGDATESSQGGGFAYDSEDGTRKNFKHTAFFKPDIYTDSNGIAEVTFKLPDNLTTFKFFVSAAANEKYNTTEKEIQVRQPLVVMPSIPRFIRPGDLLEIGGIVVNQTGKSGTFSVNLQSDLLASKGAAFPVNLAITDGASSEATIPLELNLQKYFKRKEEKGNLFVRGKIEVSGNGEKDALVFEIPIRESPPEEAFSISGFTDATSEEKIKLPTEDQVLPYTANLEMSFSSTALSGLGKAFSFYHSNPYYCLEQRASAYFLTLTAGEMLKDFNYKPPAKGDYDFNRIESLFLDDLSQFQNEDGGYRLWSDYQGRSQPYLTAYVLLVLEKAKQSGKKIPDTSSALNYLSKYVQRPDKDTPSYLLDSLALLNYVMSVSDEKDSSIESYLIQNKAKLSLRAKGYLLLSLAKESSSPQEIGLLQEDFKNAMIFTTRGIQLKEPSSSISKAFGSDGATTGVVLKALLATDSNNPLIPMIVEQAMKDKQHLWNTSHSSALLADALRTYYDKFESDGVDFTTTVQIGNQKVYEQDFKKRLDQKIGKTILLEQIKDVARGEILPFSINKKGKGRLYYTATLSYALKNPDQKPRDEGLEVVRQILPLTGTDPFPRGHIFKRGDMVLVRVAVTGSKWYYHFALHDAIPSNWEIVNSKFATESVAANRALLQKRGASESDSWWWLPTTNYTFRDDAAIVTEETFSPGMHEYYYLARPILKGKSMAPASRAFLMYEPEIFGRSESTIREVR